MSMTNATEDRLARAQAVDEEYEKLKRFQVDPRRIVFLPDKAAAEGGFGIIRRAELYESAYLPVRLALALYGPPQLVAVKQVKMTRMSQSHRTKRAFTRELLVWSTLPDHPGIAKFLGFHANFEGSEAWLLSPWEPNGNVSEFIKAHNLELSEKLSLVYDTIDALAFLHDLNPPVCHGDVKSGNVLITAEYKARLCDFGLARLYEDSEFGRLETSTGHKGSLRWCSPELIMGDPRSPVSDVYAWAWLVWEIMTGELPHQQARHDLEVLREIFENPVPRLDGELGFSQCPKLWELMTSCWNVDPPLRPTAGNCKSIVSYYPRSTIYAHAPANRNPQTFKNLDEKSETERNPPSAIFPSLPHSTRSLKRAPLPGAAEVPIGAIVEIQAGKGIVRYNGITKFAPGRWIGVELSEPQGKNDGSVDGEAYFSCKMKYGLFIRPALIKSIELPSNLGARTSRSTTTMSLFLSTVSTPSTRSRLEASVSNTMPVKSTMSAYGTTTEPAGSRNRAISINDIVLEGPDPIDVTGHFADLFVGMYRNKVRVALKRLRIPRHPSERHRRDIERFEREAELWTLLDHPHILRFIGIYRADGYIYLTSPFMEHGNLAHYIETKPNIERTSFLLETADAVTYLHSKKIVHGDIKARNILVSISGHALLCDFGLAKWAHSVTASASKGGGSALWQSPELLMGQSRCFASDTYAFGITIAEVLSGKIPFTQLSGWTEAAIVNAVLSSDHRPLLEPTHSPTGKSYQHLWNIATSCWNKEPASRPAMAKVLASLRESDSSPDAPSSSPWLVSTEPESQMVEGVEPASPPSYPTSHSSPYCGTPLDATNLNVLIPHIATSVSVATRAAQSTARAQADTITAASSLGNNVRAVGPPAGMYNRLLGGGGGAVASQSSTSVLSTIIPAVRTKDILGRAVLMHERMSGPLQTSPSGELATLGPGKVLFTALKRQFLFLCILSHCLASNHPFIPRLFALLGFMKPRLTKSTWTSTVDCLLYASSCSHGSGTSK